MTALESPIPPSSGGAALATLLRGMVLGFMNRISGAAIASFGVTGLFSLVGEGR